MNIGEHPIIGSRPRDSWIGLNKLNGIDCSATECNFKFGTLRTNWIDRGWCEVARKGADAGVMMVGTVSGNKCMCGGRAFLQALQPKLVITCAKVFFVVVGDWSTNVSCLL